jgi:hypothetical protein
VARPPCFVWDRAVDSLVVADSLVAAESLVPPADDSVVTVDCSFSDDLVSDQSRCRQDTIATQFVVVVAAVMRRKRASLVWRER